MSASPSERVPRVTPVVEGPLLMEGPAEIVLPDGSVVLCERPVLALCTCRRTLRPPFCDTSHRPRLRVTRTRRRAPGAETRGATEEPGPS
ncbi:CDGSH iron-sulfur domain-containing protein [Streptomyces sp. NPDC015130]|uniref:CDGSH iron-sulfur domain-containing protein n=1 Tax=Streptomyces sp. NPDC015130 TaxID=3364940 RepID=UPI003702C96E